jgi:hypothetical protein
MGGVVLSLPFLEGLMATNAMSQTMTPRRFIGYHYSNGVRMGRFWPNAEPGPLGDEHFSDTRRTTHTLEAFRDKLLFLEGLDTRPSFRNIAGHVHGNVKRWTASRLQYGDDFGTNEYDRQLPEGPSIDQVMAAALHPDREPLLLRTRFPTSTVTYQTISWLGEGRPATMESNPWDAYQDLVGLSNADAETRARIIERRQSVIDLVREELTALQSPRGPLSTGDRRVVDQHLTSIRQLETSAMNLNLIEPLPPETEAEMERVGTSTSSGDRPLIHRMHMDLLAMSLAADVSRVGMLLFGRGSDSSTYRWLGQTEGHHGISHGYANDIPDWQEQIWEIDVWHTEQFAYLLERLASYPEPGPAGDTLLDNTVAVYTNEMANGHEVWDMPYVLAGSCGGYFRQGEYIRVSDTHNRLLTTILNAVGVRDGDGGPVRNFGVPGTGEGEYESAELATLPEGEISEILAG